MGMRKLAMLIAYAAAAVGSSQPLGHLTLSQRFGGLPPNDTVDVNMDGIPDLLISGSVEAGNGVPGASVRSTRTVSTLSGTGLLHRLERDVWPYVLKTFAAGDTVPAFWNDGEQEMLPEWIFTGDTIAVGVWDGQAWMGPGAGPQVAGQVFVFRTYENNLRLRGSFTIELLTDRPEVRVVVGTVLRSDVPLIAR